MEIKVIASGSGGNGYALSCGGEILLIECGVPGRDMLKTIDYRVIDVAGCVCSHVHKDHMGYVRQYSGYGFPVYGSPAVADDVGRVYKAKINALERMKRHLVGNFTVIPFRVPHDGTECDGWLITRGDENILFMTDLEYCPYNFSRMEIQHVLVECNYAEEYLADDEQGKTSHVLRGHMELETCKRLIQALNQRSLRSIGLIHLSGVNGEIRQFSDEVAGTVPANVDVWVADAGMRRSLK